mgnify:CR=1 FL=1
MKGELRIMLKTIEIFEKMNLEDKEKYRDIEKTYNVDLLEFLNSPSIINELEKPGRDIRDNLEAPYRH